MLEIYTGTYVGNGGTSGTRAITGFGFQPKFVFVWSDDTAEIYPAFTYASALAGLGTSMGYWGENAWNVTATCDRFQSLDADGFTISIGSGTAASLKCLNKSGATFYVLALGGSDVFTGSYTGNGLDNRDITGIGFQPIWVKMMGGNQHLAHKMNSSGASTDQASFMYNGASAANVIQLLQSDGFQVGTAVQSNTSPNVYYYMAVKGSDRVYNTRITGDSADNRNLTGFGFQPKFALMKSTAAKNPAIRSDSHVGDLSKYYRSVGFAANYIQSFLSDGIQIGSAADINNSGESIDIIAFGIPAAPPATAFSSNLLTMGV